MNQCPPPKQTFNQRFPPYIPAYYRFYSLVRKIVRQSQVRMFEAQARKKGPTGIIEDGTGRFALTLPVNPVSHINKCALWVNEDLISSKCKFMADELVKVREALTKNGLMLCSAAGTFVKNTYNAVSVQKKLWEDTWVLSHGDIKPEMRVLDVGGASTPFSFYLASLGCLVDVIDNDWGCCGTVYNANYVAKKMKWNLNALDRDIAQGLPFDDNSFDRVFSICVIEHLTSQTRRQMMKEIGRVLKPGGLAGFTTDYDHERAVLTTDKGLRFGYFEKFQKDVIEPSGLRLIGNTELIDASPEKNFLGAFFLQKV